MLQKLIFFNLFEEFRLKLQTSFSSFFSKFIKEHERLLDKEWIKPFTPRGWRFYFSVKIGLKFLLKCLLNIHKIYTEYTSYGDSVINEIEA